MRLNLKTVRQRLDSRLQTLQRYYQDFRLYDVGSFALNRMTSKKGYTLQKHLAYGLQSRQRFDLFKTKQPLAHRPLMIFVHGGAWLHGDKKDYQFIGESFAKEGYDVLVMNYHLAPQHIFPKYVHDLQLLLKHIQHNAQLLNLSMQHVVLMGHSAGAFNVLSAIYHPDQMESLPTIRAVVGLAGPYHFDYKGDPLCQDAFDQTVPYQQVMPYYFVAPTATKHYLFIAEKDQVVKADNSYDLDRALKASGNHSEVICIEKLGHISIIGSVASVFSPFFSTKKKILAALAQSVD